MIPANTPSPPIRPASAPGGPHDDAEDRRLVARVCAHELAAFETLYRRYHPRLCRFLHRMLRPEHLVEEVLDDTLHVVWNQAERFNGTSKVSTWIFAIAYRKALKALQGSDEAVEDTGEESAAPGSGPDDHLERREARDRLLQAIRALSPDHRAVVELTYFHGLGYREIAQIVDCPVDTVKTRMFHARRRLRGLLAGDAEDWL
jgi:RNA polymerase sigma-70 factor (ECF subfamily)